MADAQDGALATTPKPLLTQWTCVKSCVGCPGCGASAALLARSRTDGSTRSEEFPAFTAEQLIGAPRDLR